MTNEDDNSDDDTIYQWSSDQTGVAKYEVYGGTYPGGAYSGGSYYTFSSENLKNRNTNIWHSEFGTGDRGVKVTFIDEVTLTSFKATFKLFELYQFSARILLTFVKI